MGELLPKGWVETELGSYIYLKNGYAYKTTQFQETGIPVLKISNITHDGNIDVSNTQFVDEKYLNQSFLVKKGDILIAMSGATTGKFGIYKSDDSVLQNQRVGNIKLRSEDLGNKSFVYYLIAYLKKEIEERAYGGAQPNISPKLIETIKIPLPPLAEQERIVAKLDALFAQIDLMKKSLAQIPTILKNFRQQVLTQAVTGKLTEKWREGKELETGEDFTRRVIKLRRESMLKKLPGLEYKKPIPTFDIHESWAFAYLQNFGEFTRGKSKHRPRNDKSLYNGKYPFIQTGDVSKSNGLISSYKSTYNDLGLKQSRLFPKGTLCITIAANIAETGILDFDACFPDSVVGYIPFENYYSAKFAMYYFNTIQQDLEHYAPSTAQKNINLGILFDVPFPVPPFEEQKQIITKVESLFEKADLIETQYKMLKEKIENLPQTILHKTFKGELVAQLPTDGDAKDLLAEIKKLKVK